MRWAHYALTLLSAFAGHCSHSDRRGRARKGSPFQKFTGLVERAERHAGLREIFRGAFLAIDDGIDQHDVAAGVAHRFERLDGGTAGGGDVLDDDDALAM